MKWIWNGYEFPVDQDHRLRLEMTHEGFRQLGQALIDVAEKWRADPLIIDLHSLLVEIKEGVGRQ